MADLEKIGGIAEGLGDKAKFTAFGSQFGVPGAIAGGALDIGGLIAGGIGESRQAQRQEELEDEQMKLRLREQGFSEAQISAKLDEIREKKRRNQQFSQALARELGGRSI